MNPFFTKSKNSMKKLVLFSLLLLSFQVIAQKQRPDLERVRAAKVGLITEKLKLTEKQAEKFWPVYHLYSDEKRKSFHESRAKFDKSKEHALSEADRSKLVDESFDLRKKELEIAQKYKPRFLDVISLQQYIDLLATEKEFNQLLLKQLNKERKN